MSEVGQEKTTPTFIPSEPTPILHFSFSDPSYLIPSPEKRQKPGSEQRRNTEESSFSLQTRLRGPPVPPRGTSLSGNRRKPRPHSRFPLPRQRWGLGSALHTALKETCKGGDPMFPKNSRVGLGKAGGKDSTSCLPAGLVLGTPTSSESPGLYNSRASGFQSFVSEQL